MKEGRLTFDVGEYHVEFGIFDDLKHASMFACCGVEIAKFDEPVDFSDLNLNDPPSFS